MVSIGRAIVEVITQLRQAIGIDTVRLATFRPLSGSDELLLTATRTTNVRKLFVANVSAGAVTMRLHHVLRPESPDQQNALFFDLPVAVGETHELDLNIILSITDTLWVRASTGGTLAFNAYGS